MIYSFATRMRNWLFDCGFLKQHKSSLPVISVGNLALGGTGKTPLVETIVSLMLEEGYHPVVISRGYGRSTTGPLAATPESTAQDIGDEPLQIYRKFDGAVPVIVSEKRVNALALVDSNCDVIVLDDGYQHRYIQRDCNILLTDWHSLYTRDHVLPFGHMREGSYAARRADIIIVTKCPSNLTEEEADAVRQELAPMPHQQLFFASTEYLSLPQSLVDASACVLCTGIAHSQPLVDHLISEGISVLKHYNYSDHHRYSLKELQQLEAEDELIVTTEKDYSRIPDGPLKDRLIVCKIRHRCLFNQSDNLKTTILNYAFKD